MNVLESVLNRRSIRKFQEKEIPNEMVDKLIHALIWAPSAGNLQSRKFYIIKDQKVKDSITRVALNQTFISKAPIVFVCCTDDMLASRYGQRGVNLYTIQDVSCSIMGMMLVAHEMGLGTVWVGAFNENEIIKILNLPSHLRPVAIIPVGWPKKIPSTTPRVSVSEAIVWV